MTGDFTEPLWWWFGTNYYYKNINLGYSLFDLGIGALLVYVLFDVLVLAERRKIGARANSLIQKEVNALLGDIKSITAMEVTVFGASINNYGRLAREATIKEIERLAADRVALQSQLKRSYQQLFSKSSQAILIERRNNIDNLEAKYSFFLESELVVLMIDLEEYLYLLEMHIAIVLKKGLSDSTGALYYEEACNDLQYLLSKLAEGARKKTFKMVEESALTNQGKYLSTSS
jgi:hypothetical protein